MSRPEPARAADVLWILGFVALLIAAGYALRDPWPADEPRFAGLARDMVHTGRWLIPYVGGDLYQDKPPLYFWLLAASYALLGSVRASFLLPSLLAGTATLLLVYDLGRRLHGRAAGLAAALLLASTLQFVIAVRGAQIDPTLLALSTWSLYSLARHLLLGPAWRWYAAGAFAAGLGVITKGVGFLPLLAIAVWFALRRVGAAGLAPIRPGDAGRFGGRWWLALPAFLGAIACWGLPMLWRVATSDEPGLVQYRNELLLEQTVTRYADSWHHVKPWYYFLVEVVPVLWLPASLLLFWLVPLWRADWRTRRGAVLLMLGWVLIVLLFFSASPGKRGIYLMPALPALVLAAAPYLPRLLLRRGVGIASLALSGLLVLGGLAAAGAVLVGEPRALRLLEQGGIAATWPIFLFAAAAAAGWIAALRWRPVAAWPAVLAALTVCWGVGIAPQLTDERSARGFMAGVLSAVPPDRELGMVAYKEQFLLYVDRPTVNFGHRRWREGDGEPRDAAAWLAGSERRVLLLPEAALEPCFGPARKRPIGRSSNEAWFLVDGAPDTSCAQRGDTSRRIEYPAHPIG
jgi:4-amino-4-deoxy-L-arabinose transferase-like glycosyltransferase